MANLTPTSSDRHALRASDGVAAASPGLIHGRASGAQETASRRASNAAWSLEQRLPVLISLLLAAVVGGISAVAYREVRATAISRATERLERVGRELSIAGARSAIARTDALHALAADSVIVSGLAGRGAPGAVEKRLAATREAADSTLMGWQLASLADERRLASAGGWSSADSAALATTVSGVRESGLDQRSELYVVDSSVHAWVAVPIRIQGQTVGTLAELRRVADNRGADTTIRGLVDDDARMLYASRGSGQWVSLRGRPVAAPFRLPTVENRAVRVAMVGGGAYAVQLPVPATPYLIMLFQSEASVLRRPQEFLRSILAAGILVLAIATVGAWFLSRHVTRPLRDVTDAAAALAHGDYARRVSVSGGGREVASLSTTFNTMAGAIGEVHAELAERNAELQRANAAKALFLAMMSHELRTPLNAIGGFTELIELGLRGPVTPEQVKDLGRIRRNKDLLLSIITDILEFTRADAGALIVKQQQVPVAPLLRDVVDAVGHQMEAKGVRLVLSPVPDNAVACADREKMQQVLVNLLSNATKFTDHGGEVVIDTVVSDGSVCIDVRDTGPGIGAAQIEDIFEPFVQVDASLTRRAGGTGLGLAIARQLAGAMGGTLTVRSTVGVGSTFSLTLPRPDPPVPLPPDPHGAHHSTRQIA